MPFHYRAHCCHNRIIGIPSGRGERVHYDGSGTVCVTDKWESDETSNLSPFRTLDKACDAFRTHSLFETIGKVFHGIELYFVFVFLFLCFRPLGVLPRRLLLLLPQVPNGLGKVNVNAAVVEEDVVGTGVCAATALHGFELNKRIL